MVTVVLPEVEDRKEVGFEQAQFIYELPVSSAVRLFIRKHFTYRDVSGGYTVEISMGEMGENRMDNSYCLTDSTTDYNEALEEHKRIKESLRAGARVIITELGRGARYSGKARIETLEEKAEDS